jgi:hypothetical protein
MNERMNGRWVQPSNKDASFVGYFVTLSVNLWGSYGDGSEKGWVSGRWTSGSWGDPR